MGGRCHSHTASLVIDSVDLGRGYSPADAFTLPKRWAGSGALLNHQNSDVLPLGTLVPAHLLLRRAERPNSWHDGRRLPRGVDIIFRWLSGRGGVRGVDRKADVRLFNNGRRRTLTTLPDPHQFMVRPRPAGAVGVLRRVPER